MIMLFNLKVSTSFFVWRLWIGSSKSTPSFLSNCWLFTLISHVPIHTSLKLSSIKCYLLYHIPIKISSKALASFYCTVTTTTSSIHSVYVLLMNVLWPMTRWSMPLPLTFLCGYLQVVKHWAYLLELQMLQKALQMRYYYFTIAVIIIYIYSILYI